MSKSIIVVLALIIVAGGAWWLATKPFNQEEAQNQQKTLAIKGSDTELQLVSNLVEAFNQKNPEAKISVAGGGSGTGIAALLNGEIEMADASRPMKDKELEQGKNKGLDIKEFILARDGLSIIIHPSNAIEKLTVGELGKIYRGEITNWREVGGDDIPIVLYGRQTTSGTYVFFRDSILKGDYDTHMKNMEGNQAVVDGVKNDKNGIGYVGLGYIKDEFGAPRKDIKVLKIASASKDVGISPLNLEAVKEGLYPISRPLFQYLTAMPKKESLLAKLLEFESSQEGFDVISRTGFLPPTKEDIAKNEKIFDDIFTQ